MSVGTLHANILFSEPGKIHCGSSDPVLGHVSIRYQPSQRNPGAELFGPLQVMVYLHGRAKTKIWKSNGQSTSIYRGRAALFARKALVYDDSFKAQPGEEGVFPFSLTFPELTDGTDLDDFDDADPRFVCQRRQPLPPSFQSDYRGFAHHYESFVEYRVGVDVIMPQLRVDVIKPDRYQEPLVRYERPRMSQPTQAAPLNWRGYVSVKNELLLPEEDRPSGFRQKTKAFLGAANFPTYAFDWVCLAPQIFHLGQPAAFEVQIKPREKECTAPLVPEVRLSYFQIEIEARTQVRADRTIFRNPESEGTYSIGQMAGVIDSPQPFSKANEYTKIVNMPPIAGPSSSFATYNISHRHGIKLMLAFQVTDKPKQFRREYAIAIHPPLEMPAAPEPAIAGPSSAAQDTTDAEPLPQYEPPPSYEKAPAGDD
ncbi:hypothetical protein F4808DRAFT_443569 [Astrocystis sublimbata]|nr:hypothetical protein F4808DRAFT_443569 [Astrocystis sublimbata]